MSEVREFLRWLAINHPPTLEEFNNLSHWYTEFIEEQNKDLEKLLNGEEQEIH